MNIIILFLLATNVISIGFAFAIFRAGARQVSELTSKVMAKSLEDYTRNEVAVAPKTRPANALIDSPMVPIDEADPEDIMRALASGVGRLNEYEREE